jgi:methionine-rich copper-binding protein CopC
MRARLLLACAAVAAGAAPALAHAFLQHAVPGAGAALAQAPTEIDLTFSEPLEPAFSSIAVTDAAGHDMEAALPVVAGPSMRVTLKPLGAGFYHVAWRAVSIDTHRTEGAYRFTVRP